MWKKKSGKQLSRELRRLKSKRVYQEKRASLKTKISEEKTRIRKAKYGGLVRAAEKFGSGARKVGAGIEKQAIALEKRKRKMKKPGSIW